MFNFNDIEKQFTQHEKETYIANCIVNKLLFENCSQNEYRHILKIVEERILGKSVYERLESDS